MCVGEVDQLPLHAEPQAAGQVELGGIEIFLQSSPSGLSAQVVAESPEGLAGFVTGYLLPDQTDTLFVWQIAVASTHRRTGLGRRLIDSLLTDLVPRGIRHLQATVTPGTPTEHVDFNVDNRNSNTASPPPAESPAMITRLASPSISASKAR